MNANATEFVPFSKYEHAEQRQKQRSQESDYLQSQAYELRQLLSVENQELVIFHQILQNHYEILSAHMNHGSNEHLTASLQKRYQAESDQYYAKYRHFNDLTSKLVELEQKLHRISMHPDSQNQSNANDTKKVGEQKQSLNAMDGIKKCFTPTPHHALAPIIESDEECIDDIINDGEDYEYYATDSDLSLTSYVYSE